MDGNSNVNDATNTGDDNNSFKCKSCNARNLYTYRGLNQQRTCLRKTSEASVISSQPDSTRLRPVEKPVSESTMLKMKNQRTLLRSSKVSYIFQRLQKL